MNRALFPVIVALALVLTGAGTPDGPVACDNSESYLPLGYYWPATPPIAENPIMLHHSSGEPSTGGGDAISALLAAEAVHRGFTSWVNTACPQGAPNLLVERAADLYEGGDRGDTWVDQSLAASQNTVVWDSSVTNIALSDSTVAYTEVLFFTDTGFVVDADLMFNVHDYSFRIDTEGSTTGCDASGSLCYDLESVALHEAGHFVGFGHVDCTSAIMHPNGSGAAGSHVLASHEQAGVCALYAPRESGNERAAFERCTGTTQCPSGFSCTNPQGQTGYGYCTKNCSSEGGCPEGFSCVTETVNNPPAEASFCKPGLSQGATTGGGCQPCSAGEDCDSGFCLTDGVASYCSTVCSTDSDCETNFSCLLTSTGTGGCFPLNPDDCGTDPRSGLNELCFVPQGAADGSDYYNACRPGLICFGFQPLCGSITGACVLLCDTNNPCPEENLTCCAGQDDAGNCELPSPEQTFGGCFDIQVKGQSCVSPEQSLCASGNGCYHFGDESSSRCFAECINSDDCAATEGCYSFGVQDESCEGTVQVCCREDRELCVPAEAEALSGLGLRCTRNADCDSGLCLKYNGEGACSRSCDANTMVGCPEGDVDIDLDGVTDGGFECIDVGSGGRCWPVNGPVGQLGDGDGDSGETPESTGCCNAIGPAPSVATQIFHVLLFSPLFWMRFRRRRR